MPRFETPALSSSGRFFRSGPRRVSRDPHDHSLPSGATSVNWYSRLGIRANNSADCTNLLSMQWMIFYPCNDSTLALSLLSLSPYLVYSIITKVSLSSTWQILMSPIDRLGDNCAHRKNRIDFLFTTLTSVHQPGRCNKIKAASTVAAIGSLKFLPLKRNTHSMRNRAVRLSRWGKESVSILKEVGDSET